MITVIDIELVELGLFWFMSVRDGWLCLHFLTEVKVAMVEPKRGFLFFDARKQHRIFVFQFFRFFLAHLSIYGSIMYWRYNYGSLLEIDTHKTWRFSLFFPTNYNSVYSIIIQKKSKDYLMRFIDKRKFTQTKELSNNQKLWITILRIIMSGFYLFFVFI